jgi:hypothetical protein
MIHPTSHFPPLPLLRLVKPDQSGAMGHDILPVIVDIPLQFVHQILPGAVLITSPNKASIQSPQMPWHHHDSSQDTAKLHLHSLRYDTPAKTKPN